MRHVQLQHVILKNKYIFGHTDSQGVQRSVGSSQNLTTFTANELPDMQIMYFMFAWEFFVYQWSPNRLALIKTPQIAESNS